MTGNSTRPDQRKLAIINRKFWPISGAAELEVANLCRALTAAQNSVDVLTVRWQKHWPVQIRYHDCDVYRLAKLSSGPFGTFRYTKSLIAHLGSQRYDGIIVFGIGEEAFTVASTCPTSALVLRVTQLHLIDVRDLTNRQKETLKSASAILADTQLTADFICRQVPGLSKKVRVVHPIHAEPNGPHTSNPNALNPNSSNPSGLNHEARKTAARVALSDAHPILQIDNNQSLVVTSAPMENDLGVRDLVRAWSNVQRQHTNARLWILGEGKLSRKVWDEIVERDLVYTAIMPGFFDNLSLVLDAADLYIHPLRTESACCVLETAKARGVCTVKTASLEELKTATAIKSSRPFVECPDRGILVPRETPTALAATIDYLIDQSSFATELGSEVQRRFLNRMSQSDNDSQVCRYLDAISNAIPDAAVTTETT